MEQRSSLRERNRERTRDELAAAAFALFREHGYDAATIEQIAAAAGVSTRTFFRYFPTKEDVVFGDHAAAVARLRAALADGPADEPPLHRVRRAVLTGQAPGLNPEREILRARLVETVPAVRARYLHLVEDFEAAVAEVLAADLGGDGTAWATAAIVAGAVFGALRGARHAAAAARSPDPRRLVENAFDVVEYGAGRLLASPEA